MKKAPDGKWEMAENLVTLALGHFIVAWSLIDSSIEVCIAKQLGLKALDSSIVTAGLQFKSRSSILLSLLNRAPDDNAEAIRIVKQMQNIGDRNDILHSVVGGSKSIIWFNRRRVNERFTSKIEEYDVERLTKVAIQCSDLASDLMKTQGIAERDYIRFFQDAHNAVNSD